MDVKVQNAWFCVFDYLSFFRFSSTSGTSCSCLSFFFP